MEHNYYIEQTSNTCYSYGYNEDVDDEGDDNNEYVINIQDYIFDDNKSSNIISNYFITHKKTTQYFCSVIWNTIEYDADPLYIVYDDSLPENIVEQYLIILQALGKFYKSRRYYKHLNPNLEKIPLSQYNTNINVINEINLIKKHI